MTKEPTTPVLLKYALWLEDDVRIEPGLVDLPVSVAKKLIADGKAERADPFPGEK